MKKKLLAIAVAGTFAAPTVAMAEWSLSGSVSQGVSVTGSAVTLGGGSGSLNMSGSTDLGNGVSGSAGFSVTGNGSGASVGLAGDFGSVSLSGSGVTWAGSGILGTDATITTNGKTASFSVSLAESIAGLSVGAGYDTGTGKTSASVGGSAGDVSLSLAYDGSSTSITAGLLGLSVSAASGGAATVKWSSDLGGGMKFGASYGTASSTLAGTLSYSF